jgi:ferredoxin-NADP reductase
MAQGTVRFTLKVTWESICNLKGFLMPHTIRLKEVRTEGENIKTFIFEQKPGRKLAFAAGQYGMWCLPRWVWGKPVRLFTIAASPTEQTLQLSTRISDSDFKQKLSKLPIGSKLLLCAPIGFFTLGKRPPQEAVLIAGGIGITPMRSLITYAHQAKVPVKTTLIHSAEGYYLYRDELEPIVGKAHYVNKETFLGTLQEVVAQAAPDAVYYISGPPAFVLFAERQLRQLGKSNIKKDGFLGY